MSHPETPWIGLAALVLMFLLPFLPNWLFEGPRTVRHRPRRHFCADCGAPWEADHSCLDSPSGVGAVRGQILRTGTSRALVRRRGRGIVRGDDVLSRRPAR
jgi:hypothetical protein